MRFFPIIFLAGFFLELASLIWVGGHIGVILTILLVMLAGLAGMTVIRQTGMGIGSALRRAGGRSDVTTIDAGVVFLRMMAGLLLLIPGFVSDAVALVVLLPPVTRWLAQRVIAPVDVQFRTSTGERYGGGPVIEGEVMEIDGSLPRPADRKDAKP